MKTISRPAVLIAALFAGGILLLIFGLRGPRHPAEPDRTVVGGEEHLSDGASGARVIAVQGETETSRRGLSTRRRPARGEDTTATAVTATGDENPATTEPRTSPEYLEALLRLKEQDGRDNAMLHYVLATELAPMLPSPEQGALIRQILDEGWDERALPLLPYLMEWQSAFEELHAGAALDYARGIGFEEGVQTPVPNQLYLQTAGRMLAVYGRYLESLGNHGPAQQQYLTALTLGRDLVGRDNLGITGMIGTAITSIVVRQIPSSADAGRMPVQDWRSTAERLENLAGSYAPFSEVVRGEQAAIYRTLELWRTAPLPAGMTQTDMEVLQQEPDLRELWQTVAEHFSRPRWQRDDATFEQQYLAGEGNRHELLRSALPNFAEMEIRHDVTHSRLRQTAVRTALEAWRSAEGGYPASLDALVQRGLLRSIPVDPFSGQSFVYRISADGRYELYGRGPAGDASSLDRSVTYDVRSGAQGAGVIRM